MTSPDRPRRATIEPIDESRLMTLAAENFRQTDAKGRKRIGATLVLAVPTVLVRSGGHLVPSQKLAVTALFGAVRLEGLELEVELDEEGRRALDRAFGLRGELRAATPPSSNALHRTQLFMVGESLRRCAKLTPPAGAPHERLAGLLQAHPEILERLDMWERGRQAPLGDEHRDAGEGTHG